MTTDNFFNQNELDCPFNLRKDMLPTKMDCLLYVVARTGTNEPHSSIVCELSAEIETIWKNADCCPFTEKHIANLFEQQIWGKYRYLKREGHLPGQEASSEKRSHKKKPNSKWCVCFLFIQGSPSFTDQLIITILGTFNFWTLPNLSERLNVRKLRCPN